MIFGDVEVDAPWSDRSIGFTGHSYLNENKQVSLVSRTIPPVASNKFVSEKT